MREMAAPYTKRLEASPIRTILDNFDHIQDCRISVERNMCAVNRIISLQQCLEHRIMYVIQRYLLTAAAILP